MVKIVQPLLSVSQFNFLFVNDAGRSFLPFISGALYATAFFAPDQLGWLVTIFLIPLFYYLATTQLTLRQAVAWASPVLGVHLLGLSVGIWGLLNEGVLVRAGLPAALMVGCLGYLLIWWGCTGLLAATFPCRVACGVVTTWLFFRGISHVYLLGNPLVVLTLYPALVYPMTLLGGHTYLLILFLMQGFVALRPRMGIVVVLALILPVRHSYEVMTAGSSPDQAAYGRTERRVPIAFSTAVIPAHEDVAATARLLQKKIAQARALHPKSQVIIMPEGALCCSVLPTIPELIALLDQQITLLMGGYRWDGAAYRTTCYWIEGGKVKDLYDKRQTLPILERAIAPAAYPRPCWRLGCGLAVVPYLCYELYSNDTPDHAEYAGATLLALVYDTWLPWEYMRRLMLLGARYRALQWNMPLLYGGYAYQVCPYLDE